MGRYSENLTKRMRGKPAPKADTGGSVEKIKCAAIVRNGKIHDGLRSHYELRRALGDPSPQTSSLNDDEGFLTTTGRFVNRQEAQDVALAAGQLRTAQGRPLLSSDIDW